jgi:hypothetical protein
MVRIKEILGALSIIILLASCGSDDIDTTENLSGLNGQWTATSFITTISSEVGDDSEMTVTESAVSGYNFDYDLVIDESIWTTEGSYETQISAQTNGVTTEATTKLYENIDAQGTFFVDNNVIILDRTLFEYEMSGLGLTAINNGDQTVTYQINNNGELVFSLAETAQSSMNGMIIRSEIQSESVWVRK